MSLLEKKCAPTWQFRFGRLSQKIWHDISQTYMWSWRSQSLQLISKLLRLTSKRPRVMRGNGHKLYSLQLQTGTTHFSQTCRTISWSVHVPSAPLLTLWGTALAQIWIQWFGNPGRHSPNHICQPNLLQSSCASRRPQKFAASHTSVANPPWSDDALLGAFQLPHAGVTISVTQTASCDYRWHTATCTAASFFEKFWRYL